MSVLSDEKRRDTRTISILPMREDDGTHSVYMTVTGLTEREALILADMLTEMLCGKEIKTC